MTLELDIPVELERQAGQIPDFNRRVAAFIRHQVALEAWRSERGSAGARALVAEAHAQAESQMAEGVDRDRAFSSLLELQQRFGKSE